MARRFVLLFKSTTGGLRDEREMTIPEFPKMAHEGGTQALTTTPVVGVPTVDYADQYVPGSETLASEEIRVTVIGSGYPFPRRAQASGSILVEVGNDQRDIFIFDLGTGALSNLASMQLPVESITKLFLTHLHADHMGDIFGLMGSYAKVGRTDPVEIWGGASDNPDRGISKFVEHVSGALAWDRASLAGHRATSGFDIEVHEVPWDAPAGTYDRDGVTISSFPEIHGVNGAVGYRLDYAGQSVVVSGDTRPCQFLVDAAQNVDLLIHECFQSPAAFAAANGLDPAEMTAALKSEHTIPSQLGQVLSLTNPRMGVVWHLDLSPGVDDVMTEISASYEGAVTVSQDFTVFNLLPSAVVARQAKILTNPPVVHGRSRREPITEAQTPEPGWFANERLDL